jgi:hypothetical protein
VLIEGDTFSTNDTRETWKYYKNRDFNNRKKMSCKDKTKKFNSFKKVSFIVNLTIILTIVKTLIQTSLMEMDGLSPP